VDKATELVYIVNIHRTNGIDRARPAPTAS